MPEMQTQPPVAPTASALLPLRAFYFFSFGALGALFPYLPLVMSGRGLSPSQVSWVLVTLPAINLLVPPLWGILADAFQARVLLLRLACVACGGATLLLLPDRGFVWHLMAVGVLWIFRSPLVPLADATVCSALGGRSAAFGIVRVWGSLGFMICVAVMGWAQASLRPVLLVSATAGLYLLAAGSTLPLATPPLQRERGLLRQALSILGRPALLLFLAGSVFYYAGHSTYDVYISLHLRALGHSDTVLGLAWAVGVGVEVGVMLAAPRLLPRFRPSWLLALCGLVSAVRWGSLSLVTSQVPLVALQALHGVTFGLWYLSLVRYVQERAPESLRASLQSVANAAIGLGTMAGYLGGGQIFERSGGATLYRFSALAALAASLLYGVVAAAFPPVSATDAGGAAR